MTRTHHLLDDTGVGGITRGLPEQIVRLSGSFTHRIETCRPERTLPGRIDADIVVIHFTLNWAKLPFLLALRGRLGRRKLIICEHTYTGGYEQRRVPAKGRFRAMLRFGYSLADRVVAVSHGQAEWIRQAKLVPASRLVAIPQARDTSVLTSIALPASGPGGRAAGPLRLGAYGRYGPQKGFDVLIDAMCQVPASTATLEFAGYGPDEQAMRAASVDLPHVHVGGQIDGAADFLGRVDAVVMPSRWEAFGLVAAEARAAGRPVIASSVDGLIEQIDPAWGLLCRPEDPLALAAAIQALADRDLTAMGAAARQSVAGAFDQTVARWSALLHALSPAGQTVSKQTAAGFPGGFGGARPIEIVQ
jgi:glycosyltransferase involved in cell wall biosynthesis